MCDSTGVNGKKKKKKVMVSGGATAKLNLFSVKSDDTYSAHAQ